MHFMCRLRHKNSSQRNIKKSPQVDAVPILNCVIVETGQEVTRTHTRTLVHIASSRGTLYLYPHDDSSYLSQSFQCCLLVNFLGRFFVNI